LLISEQTRSRIARMRQAGPSSYIESRVSVDAKMRKWRLLFGAAINAELESFEASTVAARDRRAFRKVVGLPSRAEKLGRIHGSSA
jgi:hypothetical protein